MRTERSRSARTASANKGFRFYNIRAYSQFVAMLKAGPKQTQSNLLHLFRVGNQAVEARRTQPWRIPWGNLRCPITNALETMTPAVTPNRGAFKNGYIRKIFRQILSTPFRFKIDKNGLKTALNGVGRASKGIGQLLAPSSSNISPWGPMADLFTHMFIDFQTVF